MNNQREHDDFKTAAREFAEWAYRPYIGEIIVIIEVYADDSGTDNRTKDIPATLGGFAGAKTNWVKFTRQWLRVLDREHIDFFHAAEWAWAKTVAATGWRPERRHKKNPYYRWPLARLESFGLELAMIAGDGHRVPICGALDVAEFHKMQSNPAKKIASYEEHCVTGFMLNLVKALDYYWPNLKEKNSVSIVYDKTTDTRWRDAFNVVFWQFSAKYPMLYNPIPADDRKVHPLQAADFVAHRFRILALERKKKLPTEKFVHSEIDRALLRNIGGWKISRTKTIR